MSNDEIRELVKRVKAGLRITKVVATRSVKGQRGDSFAGFSAAWSTVQEDAGHDMVSAGDEGDAAESTGSMSLQEAIVASCLLGREADIAAHRNAMAGGNIGSKYAEDAIAGIKSNYAKIIARALTEHSGPSNGSEKNGPEKEAPKDPARV
jgi:hypothetical protein